VASAGVLPRHWDGLAGSGNRRSGTGWQLSTAQFAHAAFYVDLLAEQGPLFGEPYTKQLDGKLRELRFYLGRDPVRVTYWTASGRRIILLGCSVRPGCARSGTLSGALARCQVEAHTVDEEG
jgi:hypothetical protein